MTRGKTVSKILEIKGFTKEQLEAEVRSARERVRVEQEQGDALEREYRAISDDFLSKQTKSTVPAHELELVHTYLKHVGKQIDQQKRIIEIRTAELDQCMNALVEAHKEKRLLEILQEKIFHVQAKAAVQVEQKEADYQFLLKKGKS